MKQILLLVVLILIFVNVLCKSILFREKREGNKCPRNCILLRHCPLLLQTLRNRLPGARAAIRRNICGYDNFNIKVCCPNSSYRKDYFPSHCGNNPVADEHIINGNKTNMGEFPWMVAMGYTKYGGSKIEYKCSGSLINARYVLTAAHCINNQMLAVIRLGEWDLSTDKDCVKGTSHCAPAHIDLQYEKLIPHPMYNKVGDYENDIALIRLNQTIDFSTAQGYILPICLPHFGLNAEFFAQNQELVVAGWGMTNNMTNSDILLKAILPFANKSLCSRFYHTGFGDKKLCVGGTSSDSCQGDSGGPLMLAGPLGPPYLQVGIVSFGAMCATPGIPAIYTSVSDYRDWIEFNIEPW